VIYYEDYYVESSPLIQATRPVADPELLNFAFTSGAIVANAIFIANQNRNTPAAFFGFAFGAGSVLLGFSGKTEHSSAAVLLGVASMLAAYVNLQIDETPTDTFHDPSFSRSAAPGASLSFSF